MAISPHTRSKEQLHTLEGDIVARDITISYCEGLYPDWSPVYERVERARQRGDYALDTNLQREFKPLADSFDTLLDELFAQNVMIEAYDVGTTATA